MPIAHWKIALIALFGLGLVSVGCGSPDDPSGASQEEADSSAATAVTDPASKGSFTKCTYTAPSSSGYKKAVVWYPCQTSKGPFAATTLTGGFLNTYDNMSWLANHLVTHGYIVFAMTPNNNLGNNPEWTLAHKTGIAMLKSEDTRTGSPIQGLVDTSKLQVMGYSKGGGGALLASADLGSQVKATQAMAPYMDSLSYDLRGIDSATICYTGTNDIVAWPGLVVWMYDSLPDSIERALGYFKGFGHLDWINFGNSTNQKRAKTYITSWMKVYLTGDLNYQTYLYGDQHAAHMSAGWFYGYAHDADY